jgi:hypothetical protein
MSSGSDEQQRRGLCRAVVRVDADGQEHRYPSATAAAAASGLALSNVRYLASAGRDGWAYAAPARPYKARLERRKQG